MNTLLDEELSEHSKGLKTFTAPNPVLLFLLFLLIFNGDEGKIRPSQIPRRSAPKVSCSIAHSIGMARGTYQVLGTVNFNHLAYLHNPGA